MLLASILRIMPIEREPSREVPLPQPLTLEEVYRDHFDFVYRQAARLGGPGVDAEDAAQEVFLIVGRKLHTFDSTSLVTTWLYGITLNVVRSLRRRSRIRRLFELGQEREKVEAPVRSIDRAEVADAHRIAYEILDKIAPKKREAFILAEFEDLSCEEIAVITETKTETVWSRLHYARKEFAERLAARNHRQVSLEAKRAKEKP
jgi:RNA polymerase sigma-70 factor (ECF subfamily)